MKESVVTPTGRAAKGLAATLGGEFDRMPEANCTADLELPVVKVKSGLFGGRTPAKTIA